MIKWGQVKTEIYFPTWEGDFKYFFPALYQ